MITVFRKPFQCRICCWKPYRASPILSLVYHSAKGLEFPYVFLPGFEEGLFPGLQTVMEGPEAIEEERRLAYVAITRAKDELYILHASSRLLYGRTSANPPSRFLEEIPNDLIEREMRPRTAQIYNVPQHGFEKSRYAATNVGARPAAIQQKSTPKAPTVVFSPGDRVKHLLLGEGLIISVTKMGADYLYEIAFDTKGTKKLMSTYAKLTKI